MRFSIVAATLFATSAFAIVLPRQNSSEPEPASVFLSAVYKLVGIDVDTSIECDLFCNPSYKDVLSTAFQRYNCSDLKCLCQSDAYLTDAMFCLPYACPSQWTVPMMWAQISAECKQYVRCFPYPTLILCNEPW